MGNRSSSSAAADGDEATPPPPPEPRAPSYYTMIKNSYQQLVNAIIRPPRCSYDLSKLGPSTFVFCGRTIIRRDFNLVNPREQRICCSMWEPVDSDRPNPSLPCIVYMHGNSSSRLEGLSVLSLALTLGATLFAFDFAGSGQSDGDFVSLGVFEKEDLQCVMDFLRAGGTTSSIALWGRSMGAATALLYGERDPSIAAMVLDSAFSSLVTLAEEIVELGRKQGLFAPGFLVRMALQFVRSSVLKTANFDIRTVTPIESAAKCFSPVMFIAAEGDHFVCKTHSEAIMEVYGGDKNLVLVDGDHNTARPRFLYDSVGIFLQQTLQIPASWMLPEGEPYIRRLPWSYIPHAHHGHSGHSGHTAQGAHFTPSVTHVGTKHAMQSPATSPQYIPQPQPQQGASGERRGVVSTDRTAAGTGAGVGGVPGEGQGEGEEMSFDEMLALSIMLNEGEESGGGGTYDEYGSPHSFEYDEFAPQYDTQYDPQYDLSDTVGASATAEAAMQANVTNSLFNLMSGGGSGCVAADPNTPELTPTTTVIASAPGKKSAKNGVHSQKGNQQNTPTNTTNTTTTANSTKGDIAPTPSKQAQMNSSERYRPTSTSTPTSIQHHSHGQSHSSPASLSVYDPVMMANESTKHHLPYTPITAHALSTSTTSVSKPHTTKSESNAPTDGVSTHKPVRGVVAPYLVTEETPINGTNPPAGWRCTMCTLHNPGVSDTCESCGIMRSS